MKLLFITFLFSVSIHLSAAQKTDATPTSALQPGRFQLFQGEYLFVNIKGESFRQKALFKLDTATGEIFECEGRQFDGEFIGKPGTVVQRHACEPFAEELIHKADQKP